MRVFLYLILSLITTCDAVAQINPDSSYYPLHVGDYWIYGRRLPTDTIKVTGDTLMSNGKKYFTVQMKHWQVNPYPTLYERVDSSGNTWLYDDTNRDNDTTTTELIMEKFSAQVMEPWIGYRPFFGDSSRIIRREIGSVGGDSISVVRILYGKLPEANYDQNSMLKFAQGIGIVYIRINIGLPDSLMTARVNGKTYGIVNKVDDKNENSIPSNFELSQNFPNPFNPSTTIAFRIPRKSFASLKVFDVLGREMRVLVSEQKEPREYSVSFDATNLPSGIYFYRLIAHGHTETKKMILLK